MTLKVIYLVSLSKYRSTGRQVERPVKKKGEELDQQMVFSSEWKIKLYFTSHNHNVFIFLISTCGYMSHYTDPKNKENGFQDGT